MKLGLVGLPAAGKTTIFNLLTGAEDEGFATGRPEARVGMATVPDPRVDWLASLYRPRRTIHAQIECLDLPGLSLGESRTGRNQFLSAARNVDALVQVVRSFRNEAVPHLLGEIDPARDLELLQTELLLADLDVVEKRIERLRGQKKLSKENLIELGALEKILPVLETAGRVASVDLTEEEKAALRGFAFLTERPVLVVVNQDEEQFRTGVYPAAEKLMAMARAHGMPVLPLCGQLELEIARLEPAERAFFLADLNLTESGIARLARAAYDLLGLISFFTVGEDEVKAWTIQAGTNARRAAGKIHSDMEKGFIRAEVVSYQDLARLGSMAKVREHGLFRLEGKEYIVQDGDIITFRFNV
ncbi:MAG: redox-regulated ATPase YchF [Firmicutes bacterium]|nr:redox-regulated ATPase YchF [Bacillota bacterium]